MKNKYIFSKTRVLIFLLVVAILGVSLMFSTQIEDFIGNYLYKEASFEEGSFEDMGSGDMQLHFIYTGQADCTAIRLPDNKVMLIDSGEESDAEMVKTYLDGIFFEKGENTIDYLILTHTDRDHIGGAITLLEDYDVKAVYRPKAETITENPDTKTKTKLWDNTVKAMVYADETIIIQKDMSITYTDPQDSTNNYSFTFYGPIQDSYSDPNDYSPVMMLESNAKRYMFTGDASVDVEEEFMEEYSSSLANFDVDVLKVGHHGSDTSTSVEFLNVVKPEYAIISCGIDNKYGHPHNSVLTNLENAQAQVLRTDKSDSIVIYDNEGTLKYVANFFEPASYYIEWWYIVLGLGVICAVLCFYPKSRIDKMARKAAKENYNSNRR